MISIGMDISKGKSMVCMLRPYGEIVRSPYEIAHSEKSMDAFIQQIGQLGDEVRVVMEATGIYHLPVLTRLKEAGLFVSVINPLTMKKYASLALRKGKTDKIDAVRIANYGIDNWFRLTDFSARSESYGELRQLGRQYACYIEIKISCKQNLLYLLERTMPGIQHLLRGDRAREADKDKLSDFAEQYWHYDNIRKRGESGFISSYCRWAKKKGYHASESKAKAIYALACNGIPTLPSNTPSTKMLVLEAVRVLKSVNNTLHTILTQMQALASVLPEYSVVRSMDGVGDVLAPRLIAEIGDISRFHNASALIAFAGIDAPPFQSGSFVATQRKISKRGSSLLRKTGYEVMQCIRRVKPKTSNVFQFMLKKEAEGKPKKVAKIAALNKFLRIYFARVKECYALLPSLPSVGCP